MLRTLRNGAPGAEDVPTLMAITIGAEVRSELTKRRSSTAWRFPGDAYKEKEKEVNTCLYQHCASRTSLSSLNFDPFFPVPPPSGTQISTLICLAVKASLKNALATFTLMVTLGNPAFPAPPKCLMTEFVRNTCVATYCASGPCNE